jgi:hypothetical protein
MGTMPLSGPAPVRSGIEKIQPRGRFFFETAPKQS